MVSELRMVVEHQGRGAVTDRQQQGKPEQRRVVASEFDMNHIGARKSDTVTSDQGTGLPRRPRRARDANDLDLLPTLRLQRRETVSERVSHTTAFGSYGQQ